MLRRRETFLLPFLLPGCASFAPMAEPAPCRADAAPSVLVIRRAWHTEIALPAAALAGPLAPIRVQNPSATHFLFGFGKRSWMVAQMEKDPVALLAGPFPGEGVVQVIPLFREPEGIVALEDRVRLPLPPGGLARLEAALAASFASFDPIARPAGNDFFLASRGYTLAYTCNTWTAEVLAAAGVPVSAAGVVLTDGVMRQARAVPGACR
jgi:hypothetical protein